MNIPYTNKNWLKGNWNQLKGTLRKQWSKLTDDDIGQIEGEHEKLLGVIMKKYGYTEDKAKQELENFKKSSGIE